MGLRSMTRPHPGTADPLRQAEKRRFVTQGFLHVASAVSPRPEGTSRALDPPHLTTSPQANHNNRSGQLIWYINRSNQNLLDNDDEIA